MMGSCLPESEVTDEKPPFSVVENEEVREALDFVWNKSMQTMVYEPTYERNGMIARLYGSFTNTTENVFWVEGIDTRFFEKKEEISGEWTTVFSKRIVEPGGTVYYRTDFPNNTERFTYKAVQHIRYDSSNEDPILVMNHDLRLLKAHEYAGDISVFREENDRMLIGQVEVSEETGVFEVSYIFLDALGAVKGMVQEKNRRVQTYLLPVELKIDASMAQHLQHIAEIAVHIK